MALVTQYNAPFEGLDVSMPAQLISRQAAAGIDNFILRQGYLQTRPPLSQGLTSEAPSTISGIGLGLDTRTSYSVAYWIYAHTLGLPGTGPQLNSLQGNQWVNEGSLASGADWIWDWVSTAGYLPDLATDPSGGTDYIYPTQGMAFVNGSQNVYFIAGPGAGIVNLTQGQYGAYFLMELAQFLLIANTIEGGQNIQQRIRWPAGPHITRWAENMTSGVPAINNAWGFVDLLDARDVITGTLSLGSVGYILRANGITQVTPTGNGLQPFDFNHLWASQLGIGQLFTQTRAQYGALAVLIAEDNVYLFTVNSINTIGDKVIDDIIYDIAQVNADFAPYNTGIYACITPKYTYDYRYLVYKLFLVPPNPNLSNADTVVWTFDMQHKNWVRETWYYQSTQHLTGQPIYADSGATSIFTGNLLMPMDRWLYTYDTTPSSAPDHPGTYAFKIESQQDLGYVSVGIIGITYINVGVAPLTVTLKGPMSVQTRTPNLGDITQNKSYYNGGTVPAATSDMVQHVAFFAFTPLTDAFFQVILTFGLPSMGPIKIVQVSVFGESKEVPR